LEFKQTVVLKFEKGQRSQWTSNAPMLYHLEALISLWMYSFLYEDEPTINYFEAGLSVSAWLDYSLKNRISDDYFSIIGSREDKDRLVCLGVAPQNIVELGGKNDQLNAKALPRDYIPFFTDFQHHDDDMAAGPKKTRPSTPEDWNTADFAPCDHLFGRCTSQKGTIYAYKHPSSPSTTPYPLYPKHTPQKRKRSR
jgi:hypothetical protein